VEVEVEWSPHFGGNGVPVWLVGGYPQTDEGRVRAVNDFWLGKGPNGTQTSEANPSMMNRYIDMWVYVASRYANESTIAAYDLFNEPYAAPGLISYEEEPDYIFPFIEKLIDSIRKVDSRHILIYEPIGGYKIRNTWCLNRSNIVFSFHFYPEYSFYPEYLEYEGK
jgi:aryl-phospho-beta-D-glucosidase BglC (GH1 family)